MFSSFFSHERIMHKRALAKAQKKAPEAQRWTRSGMRAAGGMNLKQRLLFGYAAFAAGALTAQTIWISVEWLWEFRKPRLCERCFKKLNTLDK